MKNSDFEKELCDLINKHSLESESNTPDYLLAKYLVGCLSLFASATLARDDWRGEGYVTNKDEDLNKLLDSAPAEKKEPAKIRASVTTVDRREYLMQKRWGSGMNACDDYKKFEMIRVDTNDPKYITGLLTDNSSPRWVFFGDAMDDQTIKMPQVNVGQPGNNLLTLAPNVVFENMSAGNGVKLQFGDLKNDGSGQGVVDSYKHASKYKNHRLILANGNNILFNLDINGDLDSRIVINTKETLNGPTDFEIQGGSDYFMGNLTLSRLSDEAMTVYHNNGGSPDNITLSNTKLVENKNDSIIGNKKGNSIIHCTLGYNWSLNPIEGRAPGIFYNAHAHVINCIAEGYTREGIAAWDDSVVFSEYCILKPKLPPVGTPFQLRVGRRRFHDGTTKNKSPAQTPGKLYDNNSWVYRGDGITTAKGADKNFSDQVSDLLDIDYEYLLMTNEAKVEAYVKANAGRQRINEVFT